MVHSATKWSALAGLYAYLCGSLALGLLYPVSRTLVRLLDLSTTAPALLLALPAAGVGAVVWRGLVEREPTCTYLRGAGFGVGTALLTVAFWLVVYSVVWSPALVSTGGVLIAFVVAVVTPVGCLAGLPLMYARRSRAGGTVGGERSPVE